MAEIPSTIDLVLEKTKHLVMTEEEKKAEKEKELKSRIKGLYNFLASPEYHFSEFDSRYKKAKSEGVENLEKLLIEQILDNIDFNKDYRRELKGLDLIGGDMIRKDIEKVEHLCRIYDKEVKFSSGKLGKKIEKKLAQSGISGSAVKPKVKGSRMLEKEFMALRDKFHTELAPVRKSILLKAAGE